MDMLLFTYIYIAVVSIGASVALLLVKNERAIKYLEVFIALFVVVVAFYATASLPDNFSKERILRLAMGLIPQFALILRAFIKSEKYKVISKYILVISMLVTVCLLVI